MYEVSTICTSPSATRLSTRSAWCLIWPMAQLWILWRAAKALGVDIPIQMVVKTMLATIVGLVTQ